MLVKKYVITLFLLLFVVLLQQKSVNAQDSRVLKCGDITEGEIAKNDTNILTFIGDGNDKRYGDTYKLDIPAGTTINLAAMPLGLTFNAGLVLLDSGNNPIMRINSAAEGETESLKDFQLGSSNQILVILGVRPGFVKESFQYGCVSCGDGYGGGYFGAYRISIGCTLRDGTVIEPGDALSVSDNKSNPLPFSGTGFPGLAPVDFSNVAKIPVIANIPMTGGVAPDGSTILGYTVDAKANDTLALNFTRLSGNLNLGLVVLSADNKVVFQASLVTSSEMTTKFTLPSDGTYTVGIFRIDLLPPAAPEATAFQLTASLNP